MTNWKDGVYCCSKVRWDYQGGQYGIGLELHSGSGVVTAQFDCNALGVLIEHCSQEYVRVDRPQDFVGLLFETTFEGNMLRTIRIHPAYGEAKPWLKTGIRTLDHEMAKQIKEWLEDATTNDTHPLS